MFYPRAPFPQSADPHATPAPRRHSGLPASHRRSLAPPAASSPRPPAVQLRRPRPARISPLAAPPALLPPLAAATPSPPGGPHPRAAPRRGQIGDSGIAVEMEPRGASSFGSRSINLLHRAGIAGLLWRSCFAPDTLVGLWQKSSPEPELKPCQRHPHCRSPLDPSLPQRSKLKPLAASPRRLQMPALLLRQPSTALLLLLLLFVSSPLFFSPSPAVTAVGGQSLPSPPLCV